MNSPATATLQLGLTRVLSDPAYQQLLRGKRLGLVCHEASVDERCRPTPAMLADVDAVVVDLQDVGTRIYTFIYTMSHVMEAAADMDKEVVVLDRPNPIGGLTVQGTTLDPAYRSFVGLYPMPTRHGMTIGELARWMNERHQLYAGRRCRLQVVPMEGRGWRCFAASSRCTATRSAGSSRRTSTRPRCCRST